MSDTAVALITYNRPGHTAQVLDALRKHRIRKLYLFSDGPKNERDLSSVWETRLLFQRIDWTRPVIVEQEQNIGLARSIVFAVDTVLKDHEQVIVLEDDCVPQRYFFEFMDACLNRYRNNEKIFGISGYSVTVPEALLRDYPYDLYFAPRIGSWGWATWRRAWRHFERDLRKAYAKIVKNDIDLDQGGSDIHGSVASMLSGKLKDVWTLNWVLSVYLHHGCYIYPTRSHIKNIGMDGTGIHCGKTGRFEAPVAVQPPSRFPDSIVQSPGLLANFQRYYDVPGTVRHPEKRTPKKPLRVVHVNTLDSGGAGKAAYRLHKGLQSIGVDSTLLVLNKTVEDPSVHRIHAGLDEGDAQTPNPSRRLFRRWHDLMRGNLAQPKGLDLFSDIATDVDLAAEKVLAQADIIHLHWAAGLLDYTQLPRVFQDKPVVWTLHDMNPFTGGCHYAGDCERYKRQCGNCPQLGANRLQDLSYAAHAQKDGCYEKLTLWPVTPSRWLADRARESRLMGALPVETIANGLPTEIFAPRPSDTIRHRLGIPPAADVVLFGADSTENKRKGFRYLVGALNRLASQSYKRDRICLLVFGHVNEAIKKGAPYPVIATGPVDSDAILADIYSAADLFVIPSLEDNLPNTVLESLACGTPVVGFRSGGIAEMVDHGVTGYLAETGRTEQLAAGIQWVLAEKEKGRSFREPCREKALAGFEMAGQAKAYLNFYHKISDGQRSVAKHTADSSPPLRSQRAENSLSSPRVRKPDHDEWPTITIVTPCLNQAPFLEASIRSVLDQDYPHIDYIILDGGSSDGSREIIEKYAQHLSCWRSHPDDGQYAAIDEGFARGRGEIMTWLNGDDILRPGALKAVAAIFRRREEVRWLTGRPNGIDAHGNDTWVLPSLPLWSRRRYLNKQYKTPYIQQEGTFWRRSLWRQAGARMRTDLKLAGDLELWTRFFRHTQLFSADVKLAAFRTHGDQKTNKLLESYDIEAELVLDEEIAQSPCHAQPFHDRAPVPITREKIADYLGRSGMQAGTEKQPNSHAVPSAAVSPQNDEAPVLVSAIVSTYNAENYIRGCLEDLLAQTLADRMEIIVVDSASEQNEGDIVREFQQRFKRLVYIRTKSRESVYAAWNRAIKCARGKYITNANTDDRHRRDAFARMAAELENNPHIALVYADVIKTATANQTFSACTPSGMLSWPQWNRRLLLEKGCFIGPQPLWRKSVHDLFGFFDTTLTVAADFEFWLRISQVFDFKKLDKPMGLYHERADSIEHLGGARKKSEDQAVHNRYAAAWAKNSLIGFLPMEKLARCIENGDLKKAGRHLDQILEAAKGLPQIGADRIRREAAALQTVMEHKTESPFKAMERFALHITALFLHRP